MKMQAMVRPQIRFPVIGLVFLAGILAGTTGGSQAADPIRLFVDASQAPQKIYHVKETIGVTPGPSALSIRSGFPDFMDRWDRSVTS